MARILIVEDNEMNLDMLSRRLERQGHAVLSATDGPAGIAAAESEQPDVILMDLSLPEMDGWEATRRLKAAEPTKHIPVIALTAHAMESDRARALAVGCDDFATKPIDLAQLLSQIAAVTGSQT